MNISFTKVAVLGAVAICAVSTTDGEAHANPNPYIASATVTGGNQSSPVSLQAWSVYSVGKVDFWVYDESNSRYLGGGSAEADTYYGWAIGTFTIQSDCSGNGISYQLAVEGYDEGTGTYLAPYYLTQTCAFRG